MVNIADIVKIVNTQSTNSGQETNKKVVHPSDGGGDGLTQVLALLLRRSENGQDDGKAEPSFMVLSTKELVEQAVFKVRARRDGQQDKFW